MFIIMLSLSLGITLWAVRKKKEGSRLALAGVGVCVALLVTDSEAFLEYYFFPAFGVLIVCLLASLSLQSKKQRRQHEKALVNAARLEIELLKKNIQPHFLMNTLTSVMEWIEEDPTTGVKFIEALADEFRILSEVSGKKLIPVSQEIELCRSHLEIMSFLPETSERIRNSSWPGRRSSSGCCCRCFSWSSFRFRRKGIGWACSWRR